MDVPTAIRIGPYDYTVECSEVSIRRCQDEAKNNATVAYHEARDSRITVDPKQSRSMQRVAMFHELLHACAHTVEIGYSDRITEEQWVSRMTPVLLDTLRRNPALVEYLTSK